MIEEDKSYQVRGQSNMQSRTERVGVSSGRGHLQGTHNLSGVTQLPRPCLAISWYSIYQPTAGQG